MKKAFLLLALTASVASAIATEPADSIITVANPDSVTIVRNPTSFKVDVFGKEGNPGYRYSYERKTMESDSEVLSECSTGWNFRIPFSEKKENKERSSYSIEFAGIAFGFVNATNAPERMNVNMASSYEISLPAILRLHWSPWRNGTSFSIGFGLGWRNYRMNGNTRFVKDGNRLAFDAYPENADIKFSRIKMFSLSVPLMWHQQLSSKGFNLALGGVVNFNTHASLKTKYVLDGTECTDTDNDLHQQKVSFDLMGVIGFKSIGFYVKYSPTHVLNTDFGPKFNHFSTGISLFY